MLWCQLDFISSKAIVSITLAFENKIFIRAHKRVLYSVNRVDNIK